MVDPDLMLSRGLDSAQSNRQLINAKVDALMKAVEEYIDDPEFSDKLSEELGSHLERVT